jgi:pimeloyl-ACP methyl ester carboxylesterase
MPNNDLFGREEVTFWSGGLECAADLYLQESQGSHPGVIIGHGWNQTKQGLRNEGRYLRDAGYNVMIIDYRTMGRSAGQPRGQIFPRRQVEDLRNAITYFSRRPDVDADRIGIYGVSFAGGLALQTAAWDPRLKVCISQSPIVNGRRWLRELRTGREYNNLLVAIQKEFEESYGRPPEDGKKVHYPSSGKMEAHVGSGAIPLPSNYGDIPPFNPDNPNSCAHPFETQESFNPLICFDSIRHVLDFNPMDVIDLIAPRPLLIVGNAGGPYDWLHPPERIQEAFARAGEPKELIFLPYDAFGLYQEPGRGDSMAAIIPFLDKNLKPKRT